MSVYVDDRVEGREAAPGMVTDYPIVVWGRDKFMSGWGQARGGYSWAGWACTVETMHLVEGWVRGRSDMRYVRVGGDRPRGRNVKHVHVYVVTPGHSALYGR